MYQTAKLVGNVVQGGDRELAPVGQKADSYFNASFILGGQIRGTEPRLFMIYPEGNFIESQRGHAVLPGRRNQIWQADHRARL